VDSVAPLVKGYGHSCAVRLATSAGSLAEHGNITLKEH
jgi:hypothetical protein